MGRRLKEVGGGDTLAVIAAGGALGGAARYALLLLAPHGGTGFPWATFLENAAGSFAIGALMVLLTEVARPHRLVRPFLGVGVLGGFTTFSTYAVDVVALEQAGAARVALLYLFATVAVSLASVLAGTTLTRALAGMRRTRPSRGGREER